MTSVIALNNLGYFSSLLANTFQCIYIPQFYLTKSCKFFFKDANLTLGNMKYTLPSLGLPDNLGCSDRDCFLPQSSLVTNSHTVWSVFMAIIYHFNFAQFKEMLVDFGNLTNETKMSSPSDGTRPRCTRTREWPVLLPRRKLISSLWKKMIKCYSVNTICVQRNNKHPFAKVALFQIF